MHMMKRMKMVAHIVFWAACGCANASIAGPVVKTAHGDVKGVELASTDVFYGIPYAAPPVGKLRWKAPQPVRRWKGIRAATKPSAACFQPEASLFGPYTAEFLVQGPVSEDCLYLNVWKPKGDSQKLPVLVYIHGGGFGSGSGTLPIYEGNGLAARGAIVVTMNYRLGVFGFLAHPELTSEGHGSSGNYGVQDMIAALHWVKTNIARFGGDADNVTVSGQSAGAIAVNDLLLSPLAQGLFQRAIAQSGSGIGFSNPPLGKAERFGIEAMTRTGATTIEQLRSLAAGELQKLTQTASPANGKAWKAPSIGFMPNIDGIVIVADVEQRDARFVSNVPLLTGFNDDEGLVFGAPKSAAEFDSYMRNRYAGYADRLLVLYPHENEAQVADSIQLAARDRYMANMSFWAQRRTAVNGGPIYLYSFAHHYPEANGVGFGAFHTAEVPYVMGALGKGNRQFSEKDAQVSRSIQDQWLAFMRTGDPSLPGRGWPPVHANNVKVMTLGPTGQLHQPVSSKERYDVFSDYVNSGGTLSLF